MTLIQNDATLASERATALANAVSALSSIGDILQDHRTTVLGNAQAHAMIEQSRGTALSMAKVISSMSSNIQSVSDQFQAVDRDLKSQFAGLEASRRFRLNDLES